MAAAFRAAGFEVWDVTMTDLISGAVDLQDFQLLGFAGGFAFGDVLDSAKGWASVIRNNGRLSEEFARYFARSDTLSLGVCNGCQLMALLGIPGFDLPDALMPRFIKNDSERFESRFTSVRIEKSPAVMLQGMEDSILGICVAHGEGRLHVPDPATLDWIVGQPAGAGALRRSRREPDHHLPVQPERQPAGDRRALLPGRPPPGDHAPPGALLPAAAVALGPARLDLPRQSVDEDVPQRLCGGRGAVGWGSDAGWGRGPTRAAYACGALTGRACLSVLYSVVQAARGGAVR